MLRVLLVCLFLVGCSSMSLDERFSTKRYPIQETKQVAHIEGCHKNTCLVQFEDNSSSFVRIPVLIGDKIKFVWSTVASKWLEVWED